MSTLGEKWRKQFWAPVAAVIGAIFVVWSAPLAWLAQYGVRVYSSDFTSGWPILLSLGTVGIASIAGYLLTPPGRMWLSLTLIVTGFITLGLMIFTVAELQHVIRSTFLNFDPAADSLRIGTYLALIGGALELGSGFILFLWRRNFI